MARIDNLSNFLTDVASAIKEKNKITTPILAKDFDTEILNIKSGGGKLFTSSLFMFNRASSNGFGLVYYVDGGVVEEGKIFKVTIFTYNGVLTTLTSDPLILYEEVDGIPQYAALLHMDDGTEAGKIMALPIDMIETGVIQNVGSIAVMPSISLESMAAVILEEVE